MRKIEDLPDDVAQIARRVQAISEANGNMIEKLSQVINVDISSARLNHFIVFLVEAGILTEEQFWTEALNWQEDLQDQLNKAERKVKEHLANLRQQEIANAGKIVTPPNGLYVPGK